MTDQGAQRLLPVFRSRTLLHSWFLELVDMTTCSHWCGAYTGKSGSWTDFVPAGSASVSLSPRLCTRLPGVRSSARLRPRRMSAARRLRQRSSPHAPCVLPSATEPAQRLLHLFGTVCLRQYVHRRHYQFFFAAEDWRLNFLSGLTAVLPHERLTVLTTIRDLTLLLRVLAVLELMPRQVNSLLSSSS